MAISTFYLIIIILSKNGWFLLTHFFIPKILVFSVSYMCHDQFHVFRVSHSQIYLKVNMEAAIFGQILNTLINKELLFYGYSIFIIYLFGMNIVTFPIKLTIFLKKFDLRVILV